MGSWTARREFWRVADPIFSTPTFRRLWAPLTERERNILRLRWDGETLDSVGEMYGLGKERIRQIESGAYAKMKRTAKAMLMDDGPIRTAVSPPPEVVEQEVVEQAPRSASVSFPLT